MRTEPILPSSGCDIIEGAWITIQSNFLLDLFNSFKFGNEDARKNSGFKLRTMAMTLIHHLGDWNAKLTINMVPDRPSGATAYRFKNEISFLIQWVPITEIKTNIDYKDEYLSIR